MVVPRLCFATQKACPGVALAPAMKKCIYGVHMALAVEQKYYTNDDVGLDSVNFDIYTAFTTTPIL